MQGGIRPLLTKCTKFAIIIEPLAERFKPYYVPTRVMRTVRSEFMEKAGARNTMYAVILTGGKQLKVEEGNIIRVEKLAVEAGDTVTFDQVAAVGDESGLTIGAPLVDGAKVTAKVLANGKGKKIRVFTYKPKCGQKRAIGHRQPFTKVRIESISK